MSKGESGIIKPAIVAIGLTVVIGGISFGIARYEIEKSKPNKEQTYALANKYYDAGDFVNAAAMYERYYKEFGVQDPVVRIDYAYSLYKSGKKDDGFAMMRSVFDIDPQNGSAQFNLAIMNFEVGNKQEGLEWLKKCAVNTRDTELATKARTVLEELTKQQ